MLNSNLAALFPITRQSSRKAAVLTGIRPTAAGSYSCFAHCRNYLLRGVRNVSLRNSPHFSPQPTPARC